MREPALKIEHGGFGLPPHLAELFDGNPSRVIVQRERGRVVITSDQHRNSIAALIDDGSSGFGKGRGSAFSFYADTPNPERLALALEDAARAIRTLMKETV